MSEIDPLRLGYWKNSYGSGGTFQILGPREGSRNKAVDIEVLAGIPLRPVPILNSGDWIYVNSVNLVEP